MRIDWEYHAIWLVVILMAFSRYIFAFLYYFFLIVPLRWLDRKLPDSRIKRVLFRERSENVVSSVDNAHRARALIERKKRTFKE